MNARPEKPDRSDERIAAAVLAAGASRRMGLPKQILPFRGRPMVRGIVEQALASAAFPVVVVLGSREAAVRAALADLPVEIIVNSEWQEGQAASVRAAVRFVRDRAPDVKALVLLLADQPLVTARTIERLIARRRRTGLGMVATERDGRLGAPALFSSSYFDELARLRGDTGARALLSMHNDAAGIRCVEAEFDVDTPDDYERLSHLR